MLKDNCVIVFSNWAAGLIQSALTSSPAGPAGPTGPSSPWQKKSWQKVRKGHISYIFHSNSNFKVKPTWSPGIPLGPGKPRIPCFPCGWPTEVELSLHFYSIKSNSLSIYITSLTLGPSGPFSPGGPMSPGKPCDMTGSKPHLHQHIYFMHTVLYWHIQW